MSRARAVRSREAANRVPCPDVPHLARALRRALLIAGPGGVARSALPGLIVIDEDHTVESFSPEAERVLVEWSAGDLDEPPVAIVTVVATARARAHRAANAADPSFISPHTVKDDVKAIFDKVGVRSRRQLASKVFEPHFQAV